MYKIKRFFHSLILGLIRWYLHTSDLDLKKKTAKLQQYFNEDTTIFVTLDPNEDVGVYVLYDNFDLMYVGTIDEVYDNIEEDFDYYA